MEKITGIYKIKNKLNGKSYIGQSKDVKKRWVGHKYNATNPTSSGYNFIIATAIRKYGIENFEFTIIEECEESELNNREIFWINHFDTYKNGYNGTIGGEGGTTEPDNKILGIIYDLENSQLTFQQIANKWYVCLRTVYNINEGQSWFIKGKQYPLRMLHTQKSNTENDFPKKKNEKDGRCVDCGKPISKRSVRCFSCLTRKRTKELNNRMPEKETLLSLILLHPLTKVGGMYDVTDNTIRKWCQNYNLPYKQKDLNVIRQEKGIKKANNFVMTSANVLNNSSSKKICQLDLDGTILNTYPSIAEAGRQLSKQIESPQKSIIGTISKCCNGYLKTAYGYIWKFIDD